MAFGVAYRPREPERTVLYQVVAEELETFLARQQERDRPVPGFVEEEFRAFLDCGILARGFLRLHCQDCGRDRLLALSCKGRVWCPSCAGRRMADTAAHLVDRVFPVVPVRQWVLSLPFALRYRLAYDRRLTNDVLNVFLRALFGELRRWAGRLPGPGASQCGAVTFIQRFGDALNANVHFHSMVIDGVYAAGDDGRPRFHPLLKHSRWCLLKRPENRTGKQEVKLADLLRYNLRTVRAFLLKEDFQQFWAYTSPFWAGQFMDTWCRQTMRSRIEPMKKVARMLRSHRELLLNWFRAKKQISGGIVEGFNNKANVTTRKAYGFRTFRAAEVALYHTPGALPDPPIAHRFW